MAALLLMAVAAADLLVLEDGKPSQYFLSPNDETTAAPPKVLDGGRTLQMAYGTRAYVMATSGHKHSSSDAKAFRHFPLAGRQINVTVDLQGASCGCNAAFYAVSMPAASPGEGNDWYCDANDVGGNSCPEMDFVEANVNALHSTPHACTRPWSSSACDRGGMPLVFGQGAKDFGAGEGFGIDTSKPFTVSNAFNEAPAGHFAGEKVLTTTVTQGSKTVTKYVTAGVGGMWPDLGDGMVLTFSFWGASSMGWLDAPPCASDEPKCPAFVAFSDLAVGPAPPLPPEALGCCTWEVPAVHCSATAGYCQATQANCETHCNGKWIHPSSSGLAALFA